MKNIVPILALVCYTSVVCSQAQAAPKEVASKPKAKPNVIFVLTDDQGYGDIAAHGNTMINTPNLDRLHEQGIRFTDFHVSPFCTPTRGALMTGRYPLRNGAWATTWGRSIVRKDNVMLPAVFADNGYRTGFFGKWHLGDSYPFLPQNRGFQEVLMHGGGGVGQQPDYWGNNYFDDTYFRNGVPEKHAGYCTDIWFSEAEKFILKNKDNPFFVYLATNAPHGPLIVSPKYSEPYVKKGVPPKMAKYYGMIDNIDENMGRLMANLDKWGLAENTILIFMTDNGTQNGVYKPDGSYTWCGYNAGMRGTKGSSYDGGHRVPFFLRWPAKGLVGGRDIDTLSAHVDIFPTLLDLCGLETPKNTSFDGASLVPLLTGNVKTKDRAILIQINQTTGLPRKWKGAVLTQRWRLVYGRELYEIQKDPGQSKDVSKNFPEVVKQLRDQYETWWKQLQPTFAEPARIVFSANPKITTHLYSLDWHVSKGIPPWNQSHVRQGVPMNGYWAVYVEHAGTYEISLRRWPVELDHPIASAPAKFAVIPAAKVRLKVGDFDKTQSITPKSTACTFKVKLPKGPTRLQSWLIDVKNKPLCGAYYCEVKRVR